MIYVLGGGGADINFKVVGGTTRPTSPKENTIWVNTSTKISEWTFSATQPVNPTGGMVWFSTGKSSSVEFNALKKNRLNVYPVSAKQYVSGSLVDVTCQSYQNGKWNNWIRKNILYIAGDENEVVTGGWVDRRVGVNNSRLSALTITRAETYLGASAAVGGGSMITTKNKIDLTNWTEIVFEGVIDSFNASWCRMAVWTEIPTNSEKNIAAEIRFASGDHSGEQRLDITGLYGSYYVGFLIDSSSVRMTRMELK